MTTSDNDADQVAQAHPRVVAAPAERLAASGAGQSVVMRARSPDEGPA